MACVLQEDQISSGTLLQNLTGFTTDPGMERVACACGAAGAERFLTRLSMGLYTPVHPGTNVLSAGEKQRLLLARALYRDTPVLLLDEFTANFDTQLEEHVFGELRALGKTVVMTAHRPSTLDRAEAIVRLG